MLKTREILVLETEIVVFPKPKNIFEGGTTKMHKVDSTGSAFIVGHPDHELLLFCQLFGAPEIRVMVL